MARARSPNRDKAYKLWIDSGKTKLLKEIAAELNVSETQIRKWKNQDKWEGSKGNVTNQIKSNVTNEKKLIVKNEMEEIESSGLTDKQKLFCLYYIQENFNKTKAYMKAYECNYETARRCGSRMLTNVDIKQEIARITEEVLEEAVINTKLLAKKIVDQYISIAFADITDYIKFGRKDVEVGKTDDGDPITIEVNYTDFRESDEVDGTLISEVKQGKDGVSVKLQDKMKAMEWLADRVDLLPEVTKRKLELEQQKVAIAKAKIDTPEDEEFEDDGFIDALKGKVEDLWEE